jgi:MFS family permease
MTLLIISQSSILPPPPFLLLSLEIGSGTNRTSSFQRVVVRLLQGFGSAAVLSVGAGSLADMYEKHERGSKVS